MRAPTTTSASRLPSPSSSPASTPCCAAGAEARAAALRVGDLQLDRLARQARRGTQRIELTAREFSVLEYLMRHAGEVVTRTMLAEHVWGDHYDSLSNLIEVFVNRLRKKLEAGGAPRLLHTVRGAGYVIREGTP